MTDVPMRWDFQQPARRTHYFEGRLLTAADLGQDQDYHRGMRYLGNRAVGWGVVEGLAVSIVDSRVEVGTGFAIDALGRELVLAEPVVFASDDSCLDFGREALVTAMWSEEPEGVMVDATGAEQFSTWLERPIIEVRPHAQAPMLVLAALRRGKKKGLTVDPGRQDAYRLRGL